MQDFARRNKLRIGATAIGLAFLAVALRHLIILPPPDPNTVTGSAESDKAYAAGNEAFGEEDYRNAIDQYSGVIKLRRFAPAYVSRGNAYLALGEYDHALQDYNSAISHDPDSAGAYFSLGTLHWLLGSLGEAETDYRKAVELDPDDPLNYSGLARVFYEENKSSEVERLYRSAFEANHNRDWALQGWLAQVQDRGDFDELLAISDEQLKKGVGSLIPVLYSGIAHLGMKQYGSAISELLEVAQRDPYGVGFLAFEPLAKAYQAKGDFESCGRAYDDYLRLSGRVGDSKKLCEQGELP